MRVPVHLPSSLISSSSLNDLYIFTFHRTIPYLSSLYIAIEESSADSGRTESSITQMAPSLIAPALPRASVPSVAGTPPGDDKTSKCQTPILITPQYPHALSHLCGCLVIWRPLKHCSTSQEAKIVANEHVLENTEVQSTIAEVLTPPATSNAVASLASNKIQSTTSPVQVLQRESSDDPFVATPIRQEQNVANPAAPALSQISAIINANLSHAGTIGIEPPREDRLHEPVSANNCQGLFVKEAKLFVAK